VSSWHEVDALNAIRHMARVNPMFTEFDAYWKYDRVHVFNIICVEGDFFALVWNKFHELRVVSVNELKRL